MLKLKTVHLAFQVRDILLKFFLSVSIVSQYFINLFLFGCKLVLKILNFVRFLIFLHGKFHPQFLNNIGFFRGGLK